MEISNQAALRIVELAEGRCDERTSVAGVDVLDQRAQISMEPYVITMLCRALRERLPTGRRFIWWMKYQNPLHPEPNSGGERK
mgnify:FL=1